MDSASLVSFVRSLAAPHAELPLAQIGAGAVVLDAATLAALADAELERSGARALREDLVRWLRSKNQFLSIDEAVEEEIEDALMSLADAFSGADLAEAQDALDDALDGLASIVRAGLGESPREVVSSDYAAELQLAVLSLKVSDLGSPLLDVGCGPKALLVRHLRGIGIDAMGIDRDAPDDALRADWLAYDYGTARWRTIVSHLGFSLHFLHAHHASETEARRYAETFLRITRSLVVGGTFAYAPSLPFFESVLPPGRFHIGRHRVHGGETLESLRKTSGLDLAEATHLTRIV